MVVGDSRWAIRAAILSTLLLCIAQCEAREIFASKFQVIYHRLILEKKNVKAILEANSEDDFERNRKSDWVLDEDCAVHKMEHVHTVMDRVCLMCHEMFSHQYSTLHFECRKSCFDNSVFRKCLNLFTAPKRP